MGAENQKLKKCFKVVSHIEGSPFFLLQVCVCVFFCDPEVSFTAANKFALQMTKSFFNNYFLIHSKVTFLFFVSYFISMKIRI